MSEVRCVRLFPWIVLAIVVPLARAAGDPGVLPGLTGVTTVFLAEIENAQPDEGCEISRRRAWENVCRTKVRVRVVRVLRDQGHEASAPGDTFEAVVRQRTDVNDVTAVWDRYTQVGAGLRYLVFSKRRVPFPKMFESDVVRPVTEKDDATADVELYLNSESLPLSQQAAAVAHAIGTATRPVSGFLSSYAVALLIQGSPGDTAVLSWTIESAKPDVFPYAGQHDLIETLFTNLRLSAARDDLLHLFVAITVRYFVTTSDHPDAEVLMWGNILQRYVPWILSSEHARATLRSVMTPTLGEQLREKARVLSAEKGLKLEERSQLQHLVDVAGAH